MGNAKYIGRVGGLAVALGVGMAIATTPGMAWAEPIGSDSSSTDSSSTASAGTATSTDATEPTGATPATRATAVTSPSTPAATSSTRTTGSRSIDDARDGIARSSGGAQLSSIASNGRRTDATTAVTDAPAVEPEPISPQPEAAPPQNGQRPTRPTGQQESDDRTVTSQSAQPVTPNPAHDVAEITTGSRHTINDSHQPPTAAVPAMTAAADNVTESPHAQRSSVSTFPATDTMPPATAAQANQPELQVMSAAPAESATSVSTGNIMLGALSGFDPLATNTPDAPVDSPMSWVVLAAARRQIGPDAPVEDQSLQTNPTTTSQTTTEQQNFASTAMVESVNSPPEANPTVNAPDHSTGVVQGSLGATDADGNPLSYTVTGNPATGTVTVDPSGSFTYTPTEAARLAAALSTGGDTDTFTVTVSDGEATKDVIVTVPVSSTQLQQGNAMPSGSTTLGSNPSAVVVGDDGRMYVANTGSNTVSVIDTNTGQLIDINPTLSGTQSIAVGSSPSALVLDEEHNRLYVANSGSNTVSVIDTTTYKMVDTNPNVSGTQSISVGSSPSALALGPDGRLYVANRGSNTVSVIDTTTYKLVDTNPNVTGTQSISVGSSPSALAVSDGKLYVVNTGSATVSVIDTSTYKLVDTNPKISGTQSISVGSSPSSVALSPDGSLAYVANGKDTVSVIDTKTNTVVRTVTIDSVAETGGHVIAVDGTHAYVTDAYDRKVRMLSLTHINTAPQRDPNAIDNPQTDETTGAVTDSLHMTDIDGDKLTFTTAAGSGPATGTVTYDAAAGTYTYTPTPATREAAAQTTGEDYDHFTVTVSDGQGATAVVPVTVTISQKSLPNIPLTTTAIDVGGGPHGVAVTGGHAYVINFSDNTVSVIDTSANTVGEPIYLDTYYGGLREVAAVAANGDHVYVVGGYDYFGIANRLVYVIDPNTNTVSDTILIDTGCNEGGCHSIYDVAASPDGERVYVASTNGYAYAIDTASGSVVDRVYTGSWFYDDKYLTVSADGSRLYVTDPRGDGVAVYDTATMDYVGGIPVGPNRFDQPHHLAVSSDGSRAYATVTVRVVEPFTGGSSNGEVITDAEGNSWSVTDTYSIVSVIDTNTNTEIATIPVRDGAWDVAVSPDGSRAYVTHDDGKTVTVIDTDTNTVIGTFTTDQGSTSAANTLTVGSDGTLYITDFADGTVYAVTVGDPSQM